MEYLDKLNWRASIKSFDKDKKLSPEQLKIMTEALRMSPSSFGLQPWKFVVVEDEETRKKLLEHSWNQSQVVDASHLIVLCKLKKMDEDDISKYVDDVAKKREVPRDSLVDYENMMIGFLKNMSKEKLDDWMSKQVYIALGFLLSASMENSIDSCPMEGFDKKAYDEILGLDELGIESVVVCPVGFRSSEDKYSKMPKVRFSDEEVVIRK